MRRAALLGILMAVGAMGIRAQQAPPGGQAAQPQGATIEKLKDNLFVIKGGGGNTAAFVTSNGVVIVDTKLANWGQQIMDNIRSVTDKPVTQIINTHTHGDHTGSNQFFPATVEIVTQENTAANMQKMDVFKDPANKHGLPDRTFKNKMTLLSGNDAIDLYYFGRAHTNGDALVVFRNARVMHAGDMFATKGLPLLDANNGGSGVDYGETIGNASKGIKNVDTVITGHSMTLMKWQ